MNATANNESAPPAAVESRLVFDWRRERTGWLRLLLFLGISFAGHAAFFYLFKVVTPATHPVTLAEQKVTLLRATDPIAAAILRGLEDRSPAGLVGSGAATAAELAELRLTVPGYIPSFASYRPAVSEPELFRMGSLPSLADATRPILPPLSGGESSPAGPPESAAPQRAGPQLLLGSGLSGRGLLEPPTWPSTLTPPEELSESHIFQIAVDSAGVVRHCFAETASPPDGTRDALLRMRFRPVESPGLMWDSVEIHW